MMEDFLTQLGFKKMPDGEFSLPVDHVFLTNCKIDVDTIKGEFFIFVWCQGGCESLISKHHTGDLVCVHWEIFSEENLNMVLAKLKK